MMLRGVKLSPGRDRLRLPTPAGLAADEAISVRPPLIRGGCVTPHGRRSATCRGKRETVGLIQLADARNT